MLRDRVGNIMNDLLVLNDVINKAWCQMCVPGAKGTDKRMVGHRQL